MSDPTIPAPTARLTRLSDLLMEAEADALARHQAKQAGTSRGPVTDLPLLDRELGGCLSAGLHILHGAPGSGKSALLLQIASSCGCPALLVTCEMRPLVLLKRLAARVTKTYLGRFDSGELVPADATRLYQRAAAEAPALAILDATQAPADGATIYQAAETTRRLESASPHLLIVVDSLHSWADGLPGDAPEYDRLNAALSSLRALSGRLCCPVLVAAERNRASMKTGGMSAAAGTRKFEYSGESVLELSADDDARDDPQGERAVTLRLAKNRSGAAGREIALLFSGRLQRFAEDLGQ